MAYNIKHGTATTPDVVNVTLVKTVPPAVQYMTLYNFNDRVVHNRDKSIDMFSRVGVKSVQCVLKRTPFDKEFDDLKKYVVKYDIVYTGNITLRPEVVLSSPDGRDSASILQSLIPVQRDDLIMRPVDDQQRYVIGYDAAAETMHELITPQQLAQFQLSVYALLSDGSYRNIEFESLLVKLRVELSI